MKFSGERLRTARKYKKLSISILIDEIYSKYNVKFSPGTVSKWENNKLSTPRTEAIEALAHYLDVPIDFLLGRKDVANCFLHQRLKRGISITELSNICGINEESIQLIETGSGLFKDENELKKITLVLRIKDFRSLLENEGDIPPCTYEEIAVNMK